MPRLCSQTSAGRYLDQGNTQSPTSSPSRSAIFAILVTVLQVAPSPRETWLRVSDVEQQPSPPFPPIIKLKWPSSLSEVGLAATPRGLAWEAQPQPFASSAF